MVKRIKRNLRQHKYNWAYRNAWLIGAALGVIATSTVSFHITEQILVIAAFSFAFHKSRDLMFDW